MGVPTAIVGKPGIFVLLMICFLRRPERNLLLGESVSPPHRVSERPTKARVPSPIGTLLPASFLPPRPGSKTVVHTFCVADVLRDHRAARFFSALFPRKLTTTNRHSMKTSPTFYVFLLTRNFHALILRPDSGDVEAPDGPSRGSHLVRLNARNRPEF